MEIDFANRLKLIRTEKRFTREGLGNLIGHGAHRIAEFEQGKREPSISELIKLCRAMRISSDSLLGISDISCIREWK